MASGDDVELCKMDLTPRRHHGENETVQADLTDNENDACRQKREKLLRAIYIACVVTVIISLASIVIGVLPFTKYTSKQNGYIFSLGVLSGGTTLLFTICPCCMYYTGRKTIRGNEMGSAYMCCLNSMIIYFAFTLCGVLITLGMTGIWGTIECVRAKQRIHLFANICLENTSTSLAISVLTLILTCALLILILIIIGIFCFNKKLFGYKTEEQRREEFLFEEIRRAARDEALREVTRLNAGRDTQNRQSLERGNHDTRHAIEPSAPMLEEPPPSYDEVVDDKGEKNPVG